MSLTAAYGATLKNIKKSGSIKCGVTDGVAGFSVPDSKGNWKGLEVDICRAIAAAVFGDPKKVKFIPLSAQSRFTALQSGEIDVLSRVTTWTLSRDTALGLNFGPTTFYDGQGFMVHKKDGIKSAKELGGASICTQQGTTTEKNLADFLRKNRIKAKVVVFESNDEVSQAFYKGRCDAYTNDASGLVAERTKYKNPEKFVILRDIISKEPLGPAVRHGDDQWFDVMKWTVFALITAEEKGINSKNIDSFLKDKDPNIRRFLGVIKGNGKALGLDEKWAYNVIKTVGNYSEIFEKNVGKDSLLKLDRGINGLWNKGGLMYAPPLR
jgi:general L-amino acid transport system substrate-binding protein